MKGASAVALLGFVAVASAFPTYVAIPEENLGKLDKAIDEVLTNADKRSLIPKDCPFSSNGIYNKNKKRQYVFDPSRLVDVTGNHAYAAPTEGQTRGPCPGLNILSNHGYFDRSGVTNFQESINALTSVLNMGVDTAVALVAYSIAIIGDPTALTWSIGASSGQTGLLGGLLSNPGGIDQSHNNYESDASVTRSDSFLNNGDVWSSNPETFKALFALQPDAATANYNQDIITQHRRNTINYSITDNNPNFFYAAFPGLVVATAAHNFVPFFFSNYTENGPILNQDVLKSFFGYTGDSVDTLQYNFGTERIPDNWYHADTPYTLTDVVEGVLSVIQEVPEAGKIGGNTGTVNSFVGVDVADVTGGVLNAQTLFQGNNLFCFAFAAARQALPSTLGGVVSIVGAALNLLDSKLSPYLPTLGCPQLDQLNLSVFNQFPGSN